MLRGVVEAIALPPACWSAQCFIARRGHGSRFPRSSAFSIRFNRPTRFEADVYDCEVWGEIPSDIEGTFYRMQCDFDYRPPKNEWLTGFNGDGHISRFRFNNARWTTRAATCGPSASWPSARRVSDSSACIAILSTDDPSVAHVNRSAANTHSYWHGGKLFVLKEDSQPWTVDPHTLETLGSWDFNGKYTAQTMSAHPKIDPVSGQMIAYGYQAKGILTTDVAVYHHEPAGEVIKEVC